MSRPRQRRLLPLLAALPLVTVLGCASSPGSTAGPSTTHAPASSFPVTVHAANGAVTIRSRPTAIISLSPAATEMLYAIGAGRQIKAVDEFSNYPPGAPRTKLDGLEPNIEAIASYKPDLVVVSDDPPSLNRQLGALGIPVLYQPAPANLAQDYAEYAELGAVTGDAAGAKAEVASVKKRIAEIVDGVPKSERHGTYYFEIGIDPYYSETDSTLVGDILGLLGLHSIADAATGAASSGGYPPLNAEFILKANPDYIFLADTICCHQSPATVAARPGWSVMSAVRDHRVFGLNDDIASRWGPRIVTLLADVAAAVKSHPVRAS